MGSSHFPDCIYIVTAAADKGEAIRTSINLRGFDRVKCLSFTNVDAQMAHQKPDLLILDGETLPGAALATLRRLPVEIPKIFLAPGFDEELFITCYDHGAKDFLFPPTPPAYLASRVLLALEESRLKEQLQQRDAVLRELSVLGRESNLYTPAFLLKLLKREVEAVQQVEGPLTLLLLALGGLDPRLTALPAFKAALYRHVADALQHCCRGSDILGEVTDYQFAILLPQTGVDGGRSLERRIRQRLTDLPLDFQGHAIPLRGVTSLADFAGCTQAEDLLNKALAGLRQPSA